MLVLVLGAVLFLMRMMARGVGTVEEALKVVTGMEEVVDLSEAEPQSLRLRVVAGKEEDLNVVEVGPQPPQVWFAVGGDCLGELEVWPQFLELSDSVYSWVRKDVFDDVGLSELAMKMTGLRVVQHQ